MGEAVDRNRKKIETLFDSGTKIGAFAAGIVAAGTQLSKISKDVAGFVTAQTQLNRKLAEFQSIGNLMGGMNMDSFRDSMNLTREQAAELTDTFRTIGVEGNMAFSQIESIASGIKDQFGALDTSMLK